jgi:hypothetical protein
MRRYSTWIAALVIFGAAVGIAKERIVVAERGMAEQRETRNPQVSSAAFRDGLYMGKLAAERGDSAHIATARWATEADRTQFATAYQQSYSDISARNVNTQAGQAEVAAFRDGRYLGKLDSANGDDPHVAVARWSKASHRAAFAEGYRQGYTDGDATRTAQKQNKMHLARVVR